MEKMIGKYVNELVALKLTVAASCMPIDAHKKDIDNNCPVKFYYEIMQYDPILREQDWAACPKSKKEAINRLHELRKEDQLITYWIEAHCADALVRNELLRTEGRYTPPVDNNSIGWVDIPDDDLPF